jgi:molecular chaperone GrpE
MGEALEASDAAVASGGTSTADEGSEREALAEAVRAAVRVELDEVVPHVVAALKRHDAVADLSRRLDEAERRLAERDGRPLVAGLRRTLVHVRRLDFDPAAKDLVVTELERLIVGAGYTEFGEVGEPFDPERHEAIDGKAPSGGAVVREVFEPGMETLGAVLAPARVRVGPPEADHHKPEEYDEQPEPEVPAP